MLLGPLGLLAQQGSPNYHEVPVDLGQDSCVLGHAPVMPQNFVLHGGDAQDMVDSTFYMVDYQRGMVYLHLPDSLRRGAGQARFWTYPEFLTREYYVTPPELIVQPGEDVHAGQLQPVVKNKKPLIPFEGLQKSGSLRRGITVGSNQDAVMDASLDLRLSGKLAEGVYLKAAISDANLPVQADGYSQQLQEFDRMYMELYSDKHSLRAGDVRLQNQDSYFMNFSKQLSGVAANMKWGDSEEYTQLESAAALVRGEFVRQELKVVDGGQGPYRLLGPNGQLNILVLSGSERVYINGVLMKRGENKDYVVNYNTGEITFTALRPMRSNMRVIVEFQYSERSFTRSLFYAKMLHKKNKWHVGSMVYSEQDHKNQGLQQRLSDEQKEYLAGAGGAYEDVLLPSAREASFEEGRILYRREGEVYIHATTDEGTLYQVNFSFVGKGKGNYVEDMILAGGRVYKYVPPVGGVAQGDHAPVVKLRAPESKRMYVLNAGYADEQSKLELEGAMSDFNRNLFAPTNVAGRKAFAFKTSGSRAFDWGTWTSDVNMHYDYVGESFESIERYRSVEFARDWGMYSVSDSADQHHFKSAWNLRAPGNFQLSYGLQGLLNGEDFRGQRHVLSGNYKDRGWNNELKASYTHSSGTERNADFARVALNIAKGFKGHFTGVKGVYEKQESSLQGMRMTQENFAYAQGEAYWGIGDSTARYVKWGYRYRSDDSLRNDALANVNYSHGAFMEGQLIKNRNASLKVMAHYSSLEHPQDGQVGDHLMGGRINYQQRLLKNVLSYHGFYELGSGNTPVQEFAYVKTAPGRGIYKWTDYNSDGIQQLDEFVVAQFQDEAEYLRIYLPNTRYVASNTTKLKQSLNINPGAVWRSEEGVKGFIAKFYNSFNYMLDRKDRRDPGEFYIYRFDGDKENVLAASSSLRNQLYYKRNGKGFSAHYTMGESVSNNLLAAGQEERRNGQHVVQLNYRFEKFWKISLGGKDAYRLSRSEHFNTRNYRIDQSGFNTKLMFAPNAQINLEGAYDWLEKRQEGEQGNYLLMHRLKMDARYNAGGKSFVQGAVAFYQNLFRGIEGTEVSYIMLEGLRPGGNFTWQMAFSRKLMSFLDLNLQYNGRAAQEQNTIHTGSVQLRAYF